MNGRGGSDLNSEPFADNSIPHSKLEPLNLRLYLNNFDEKIISFTSFKQPIWISNFCNTFLFTYFVSKYWQDKSFKLRPEYIKKCQYNFLHKKFFSVNLTLNSFQA